MPDRTTLARLGKLVAADVTSGQPGANSWAASQALEAHPEAVLDLIEMLLAEGRKTRPNEKLVSAYVYMIGQALEFIRIAAENGQASAQELADSVRLTLLQAGTSGLVQPVLLVMVLMEFSNAKLDPGAELQHLMANLFEQIGSERGAGASGGGFDSYLEDLAEEVGGATTGLASSSNRCCRAHASSWLQNASRANSDNRLLERDSARRPFARDR